MNEYDVIKKDKIFNFNTLILGRKDDIPFGSIEENTYDWLGFISKFLTATEKRKKTADVNSDEAYRLDNISGTLERFMPPPFYQFNSYQFIYPLADYDYNLNDENYVSFMKSFYYRYFNTILSDEPIDYVGDKYYYLETLSNRELIVKGTNNTRLFFDKLHLDEFMGGVPVKDSTELLKAFKKSPHYSYTERTSFHVQTFGLDNQKLYSGLVSYLIYTFLHGEENDNEFRQSKYGDFLDKIERIRNTTVHTQFFSDKILLNEKNYFSKTTVELLLKESLSKIIANVIEYNVALLKRNTSQEDNSRNEEAERSLLSADAENTIREIGQLAQTENPSATFIGDLRATIQDANRTNTPRTKERRNESETRN